MIQYCPRCGEEYVDGYPHQCDKQSTKKLARRSRDERDLLKKEKPFGVR